MATNMANLWRDVTANLPTLDDISSAYKNIKNSDILEKYSNGLKSIDMESIKTTMSNLSNDVAHAAGVGIQAAEDKTKSFIEKYNISDRISSVLPEGIDTSKFKDVFSNFSSQVKDSMNKAAESETVKAVTESHIVKNTVDRVKNFTESPTVQNAVNTVKNGVSSLKRSFMNGRNDYSSVQNSGSADGPDFG